MSNSEPRGGSELVRQYARETFVRPARRRGQKCVSINVGEVHKAVALQNRVPLVCQALRSEKFLSANGLRLISQTGPPSGQSTTVTYTYEFIDNDVGVSTVKDPWLALRGALRDVFSQLGGGEAYLRNERDSFYAGESSPAAETK